MEIIALNAKQEKFDVFDAPFPVEMQQSDPLARPG
jgi:hypothetical protein